MKQCPICEKTFDDNMRFCQSDGTALVEAAEPIDPYKTMVARPGDIAAAIPPEEIKPPFPKAFKVEDDVLEIPTEADPNKTQFVSEEELRREMADEDQVIDIPPAIESTPPEPPKFIEPNLSPPSFASSPPPSPFDPIVEAVDGPQADDTAFSKTSPPIPSPFGGQKSVEAEPGPSANEPEFNPFDQPAEQVKQPLVQAEWTPPAAPEAAWQNQDIGANTPFQPPPAGVQEENKTMAMIALVLGILAILPCCGFISGIPAIIVGFIARSRANNDPANYGGGGLALAGIITGIIGTILWGIITILQFVFLGVGGVLGNF